MLAGSTLYREGCGFGGECAGTDYNAGNAHKRGYVVCSQIAYRDVVDGGMKHQLMLWKHDIGLLRIHYALGTLSKCGLEERNCA